MQGSNDHVSTRRRFLAAGAGLAAGAALLPRHASGAEFSYKLATGQDPTHPVNVRAKEALDRIREATKGRVEINLFPANQLGSDTDLLSQVRSGGVEFFNLSTSVLATLVPVVGIVNTGFAFPDYDTVWKSMDGDVGTYIREQIAKSGILTVSRPWDNGFRQVTSSSRPIKGPDDLRKALLRRPEQFAQTFTEGLLTYATGRKLEYYDMPTVRRIVRGAAGSDYRFSALVQAVVRSEQFRMRRAGGDGRSVATK